MTRELQERISLLGAIVAILAFGITLGKTVDLLSAIGMVGLAYLMLGPFVLLLVASRGELGPPDEARGFVLQALAGAVLLWAAAAWNLAAVGWSLRAFVLLFLGAFTLLVVPFCSVALMVIGYRERHKTCPECANEILAVARICHFCGYRWQPPLRCGDPPPGQ